jgi:hypothetical protein
MNKIEIKLEVSKETHDITRLLVGIFASLKEAFADGKFDIQTELVPIILNALLNSSDAISGIKNIGSDWDEDTSKVLNAILPELLAEIVDFIKVKKSRQA